MPDRFALTPDPWFCLIQNVNRADRPPRLTRARPRSQGFMLRIAAIVLVIGASLAAGPAAAQFGNHFRQLAAAAACRCSQWRVPGTAAGAGRNIPVNSNTHRRQPCPPQLPRGAAAVRVSRPSRCRRLPAPRRASRRPSAPGVRPPPAGRRRPIRRSRPMRSAGQSAAAATGGYPAAAGRYGRHRDADAEDPQRPGGVFRPRQDHRPHHFVRCGDRRNGAIRRAAGHGAGVLHAAADRGDEYGRLRRGRRGDAQGRDQAHLHRLDVRLEPRPACRRASDLRRLADRLFAPHPGAGAGGAIDAAGSELPRRPRRNGRASAAAPAASAPSRRQLPARRSPTTDRSSCSKTCQRGTAGHRPVERQRAEMALADQRGIEQLVIGGPRRPRRRRMCAGAR